MQPLRIVPDNGHSRGVRRLHDHLGRELRGAYSVAILIHVAELFHPEGLIEHTGKQLTRLLAAHRRTVRGNEVVHILAFSVVHSTIDFRSLWFTMVPSTFFFQAKFTTSVSAVGPGSVPNAYLDRTPEQSIPVLVHAAELPPSLAQLPGSAIVRTHVTQQ